MEPASSSLSATREFDEALEEADRRLQELDEGDEDRLGTSGTMGTGDLSLGTTFDFPGGLRSPHRYPSPQQESDHRLISATVQMALSPLDRVL